MSVQDTMMSDLKSLLTEDIYDMKCINDWKDIKTYVYISNRSALNANNSKLINKLLVVVRLLGCSMLKKNSFSFKYMHF